MPASHVHQSIASDAASLLGLFREPSLNSALRAGAEGPDPLFYSLRHGRPSPPALGSKLHGQRTADLHTALARRAHSDRARAYVCGFFSHYATDTTFHPYVYAHALDEQHRPSGTLHCLLEHQWETMLYRRQGHPEGLPVQMAGFAELDDGALDELAGILSGAMNEVFPESTVSAQLVRTAYSDCVRLCQLLRSETGTKFRLLGNILSPFHLDMALHAHMMPLELPETDIANEAHAPWVSLWEPDRLRSEGFEELYKAAVARSMELMRAALAFMDGRGTEAALRACHGDRSYDSALPWQMSCSAEKAAKQLFETEKPKE